MSLSPAMGDYLAEAYRIAYYQEDDPYIATSALAEATGVSAPAVTRMVQRLKDAGYVEYEPYRGIRLTDAGVREALQNIRRHRLVEVFLVRTMGYQWYEVHDSADALGAVVSDAVVARMAALTGDPRRCPHGEPIPTADGVMPRVVDHPLSDSAAGETYAISRVNTHDIDKLAYLGELGLTPGATVTLKERAPFQGPLVLITADAREAVIGHELARVLRVCAPDRFAV